ncbi:class I SAM-dependent rRNA methyltransferase [Fluviispira sanaruensis]|uniref:Class I SAM-dependent rRNA methyltransferase n=1 Tax=Fluviispira sanaruensis TaxID=2493639 RepID=A0A4P2VT95_FLUSA|nr:class I SAM-dependent rRNA methyltransferase [Fluviispira sanaruensis]BBH52585.1 class I SAM-dependent rRNA methyltransferase [Fluviispira sanaruensis]
MFQILEIDIIDTKYKYFKSPWIFSNQVKHLDDKLLNPEKICLVRLKGTKKIGIYNKTSLISIRLLPDCIMDKVENNSISSEAFIEQLSVYIKKLQIEKNTFAFADKEAYRLSHGDNDGLPALAIDDYKSVLVLQSSAAVGDFLLPYVVEALKRVSDLPIFERSTGQIRKLEQLPERTRWIEKPKTDSSFDISCFFAHLTMSFSLNKAQKTGLFLDQRNNLKYLAELLKTYNIKKSLDICSYAGAWSAIAARSGVSDLTLIDQDAWALQLAQKNVEQNALHTPLIRTLHGDMFEHLQNLNKSTEKFDLIIADPPAFAKAKKNVAEAKRAYTKMTRLAHNLLNENGILVVCSCSRHIEDQDFLESVSLGLSAQNWVLLHKGEQSPCHTRLATPDSSEYLKCYFIKKRVL